MKASRAPAPPAVLESETVNPALRTRFLPWENAMLLAQVGLESAVGGVIGPLVLLWLIAIS
jgi:hypothetical protein